MEQNVERRLRECGFTALDVDIVKNRCNATLCSLHDVKTLLDSYDYDYDWAEEYVVRSASMSLQGEKLTCINTALLAYAMLGAIKDEDRTLLAIHRRSPDDVECGHVVAVGTWQGRFFALGKSNYPALNSVFGPYTDPHAIALAFARAYTSMSFTPLYYGFFRPEDCCSVEELIGSERPLNELCDFMVSNYQYAYDVKPAGSRG